MKANVRSSFTLPPEEAAIVERLRKRVGAKSNVAVVRRALRLLDEVTDRERLKLAYEKASLATRASLRSELSELDHLAAEGLDE